jgi:hypothetical protein
MASLSARSACPIWFRLPVILLLMFTEPVRGQSLDVSAALDTPDYAGWRVDAGTSGTAAWQLVSDGDAFDGQDALRFAHPPPWPATSEISMVLRGPAAFSFWWKAINGTPDCSESSSGRLVYGGGGAWEQQAGFLTPGEARVRWSGGFSGVTVLDMVRIDTATVRFLEALDAPELTWSGSGWTGLSTAAAADGVDCAVAPATTGAWLQTTVTGPAVVSFHYYRTGGVCVLDEASNSWQAGGGWMRGFIPVPRGEHLLRWEGFVVLDRVTVAPPAPDIAEMLDTTLTGWSASTPGPLGVAHTPTVGGDTLVFANVKPWLPQWVETTVTGPGALTWRWSRQLRGQLNLTVNGEALSETFPPSSGSWAAGRLYVPAGPQSVRWTASGNTETVDAPGGDQLTVQLDDVQFVPAAPGEPTLMEALEVGAAPWTAHGPGVSTTHAWQILTGAAAQDGVDAITGPAGALLNRRLAAGSTVSFYYKGGPASVNTRAETIALPAASTWTQRTVRTGVGADTVRWSAHSAPLSLDGVNIQPLPGLLESELDLLGQGWATYGNAPFHAGTAAESWDGADCAVAGPVTTPGALGKAMLETAVQGPGTLAWRWRMDGTGYVSYSVDTPEARHYVTPGSAWSTMQVWVPEGPHVIMLQADFDSWTGPSSLVVDRVSWTGGSTESAGAVLGQPQWAVQTFPSPLVQVAPPDSFSSTLSLRLEDGGCVLAPPLDGPVRISWQWRNTGTTYGGWFMALPDDDRAILRWPALVRQQQVAGFQSVAVNLPAGRWRCGWLRREMINPGQSPLPLTPLWLKNVSVSSAPMPSPGSALGLPNTEWTVDGLWAAVYETNLNRHRLMFAGWPGGGLNIEGLLATPGRMVADPAVPQRITITQGDLRHALPGNTATTTFFPSAGAPPLRMAMTSEMVTEGTSGFPPVHVLPGVGVKTWQPQPVVPLATALDAEGLTWTAPLGGWSGVETEDAWSGGACARAAAGLPLRAQVTGPGLLRLWHRIATGGAGNAALDITVNDTPAATLPATVPAWVLLELDLGPGTQVIEVTAETPNPDAPSSGLLVDGAVFLPGNSTGFGAAVGQPSWLWVREGMDWNVGSADGQPALTCSALAGISSHGTWLEGPGMLYMEHFNTPEYTGPGYQHDAASLSGGWTALFYQLPAGRCHAKWQNAGSIRNVSFQPGPLPSAITALGLPADSEIRSGPDSVQWVPMVNGTPGTQGLRARLHKGQPLPWLEADLTGPCALTLPAPAGIQNLQQRFITLSLDGVPFARSPADAVLYFPIPAGRHTLRWQLEGRVLDIPLTLSLSPWTRQEVNPALTVAGVLGDAARAWQTSGDWQPLEAVPAAFRPEAGDATAVFPPAGPWSARAWLQTSVAGPAQVNYAFSTHAGWSLQLDGASVSLPFNSTLNIPAGNHVLRFLYAPATMSSFQGAWSAVFPAPPPRLGRVTVTPNTPIAPLTLPEISLAAALDAPWMSVAGFPAAAVTGINTAPDTVDGDCVSIPSTSGDFMEAAVSGPAVATFSWTGGSEPFAPRWQMQSLAQGSGTQLRVEGFGVLDARLPFSWTRTALPIGAGPGRMQWRSGNQTLLVDHFTLTPVPPAPLGVALETDLPLLVDPPDSWQGGAWGAVAADGDDCANCRLPPGDPQAAGLAAFITGPRRIVFRWRATGESSQGIRFRLLVNEQPLVTCAPGPAWSLAACDLPAGEHVLRWKFDNSAASAETTAWLDTLQSAPAPWYRWLTTGERTLFTDPRADADGDGWGTFEEFAFGSDPWNAASVIAPPIASFVTDGPHRYLALTWRRGPGTEGLPFITEHSADLFDWQYGAKAILPVSSTPHPDGSVTETVRDTIPWSAAPRRFFRLRPDGP